MEQQIFTVKEVAEFFRVGVSTVWRWVQNGDFPQPVKFGGNTSRWLRADLDAHITKLAAERTALGNAA